MQILMMIWILLFCCSNVESFKIPKTLPNIPDVPNIPATPSVLPANVSFTKTNITIPDIFVDPPKNISDFFKGFDSKSLCTKRGETGCQSIQEAVHKFLNRFKFLNVTSPIVFGQAEKYFTDLVESLDVKFDTDNQVFSELFQIASMLLNCNLSTIVESDEISNTSTKLLTSLDLLATKIGFWLVNSDIPSYSLVKENLAFTVAKVNQSEDVYVVGLQTMNGSLGISITESEHENDDEVASFIVIPKEALIKTNGTFVHTFCFGKGYYFMKRQHMKPPSITSGQNSPRLQSSVFSATIGNKTVSNLENPVKISFRKASNYIGNETCQYWDFNKDDWSQEGCTTLPSATRDFVTCQCNHLTNFALILNINQDFNNPLTLKLITWIGCGISIAALSMTILVFVLVRKYRQNLSSKILVCLCLSLLITMVIFLVGAERTSSRSTCQVISGLMQYFLLATFCWTAVEAFNLYMNFVVIFHASKHENGLFHRLASIAWCTPLVVVIITVGADSDELGNDDLCVVHGYAFFLGLLLPICLILMGNVIVLIFALRGMRTPKTIKGVKDRHERILQLWRVFVCSTILGLTWAFAVLAIGDLRDIFQYLFSIFNSLQGFIIFLIFVVAHKDKRKEILKVLSLRSYGGHKHSMSVKSSSSGFEKGNSHK